jgi:hypothetical protein
VKTKLKHSWQLARTLAGQADGPPAVSANKDAYKKGGYSHEFKETARVKRGAAMER